ncbi:MAG: DUF485 domain-containing protein [Campylobacterota bacterium]|nr:DUF485 domain-containing protein [Campylobacterota bacterium]
MQQDMIDKVKADPAYQELVTKRGSFAVKLSVTMLVVYFAFILTIAFNPAALGSPLSSDSVTTIGIPIGMFVIVFAFALTGVYVKRANSEFDDLNNKIKENIQRGES